MREFFGKLVTFVCIAAPAWYFGVLTLMASQNGGLAYMEPRGWIYFSIACAIAFVGLVRLFEIPVLRYRIMLVDKDSPPFPKRATKL